MAIERRAVKKRILKSGKDRTDTAVYVLLKYGITDDADVAQKLVVSKNEVLFPSDLSYFNDQIDQDVAMGKVSPEVEKIRNALAEFYGIYEPEQETEEDEVAPDGLDDLLGSIREEELEEPSAPPSSALAIYEGVGGEDIVEEEIDERILKLLKLDGVHDIDYTTYMTLLKERMVASRMPDSSISTEEDELLRDEFKRVKGKVGRFKLKRKTISAEDLTNTGSVQVSDDQFFLASSAVIPKKSADPEAEEDDSEVLKKLDDILSSLRMENKEEKKKTRNDKKDAEEEKRRKREKKLESNKRKEFKNLVNNVVAPVNNILQDIIRWFKFTFVGFFVNQVLGWFKDPKNKKNIDILSGFLKSFWPAILAAAVLFLTPFGAFIRSTIKLLRWAIPKMFGILKKNPWMLKAAGITALAGAGLMIPQAFPNSVNEQERKTASAPGTKDEKIAALKKQKENLNPLQIIQGVGAEIDEQIKLLETGQTASYGAAPLGSNNSAFKLNDENTDLQFQDVEGMSGGGIVHNIGGSYNNYTTLDSEGSFQPMFGFTSGGIVLPTVNVPKMNTKINLFNGGGMISKINLFNGGGMISNINLFSGGGKVNNRSLNINDIRFEGGGSITNNSGINITGAGPDTQLIAAKPGEIVMSTEAVNHWGASTLLGMNKAGGGTNVPKMANNIQMASGGGMIGSPNIRLSSSFGSVQSPFHGPPDSSNTNYSYSGESSSSSGSKYSVSGPIMANNMGSKIVRSNSAPKLSVGRPSISNITKKTPFKYKKLNKASIGQGKKSSSVEIKVFVSPAMNPVKAPTGNTKPNIIQLPTKTTTASPPTENVASAPDIPKFSAIRSTAKRKSAISALGVSDLIG